METKRIKLITSESETFIDMVEKAKLGDKKAMEKIIVLFGCEIEYLSRFIMLPREEAHQILETELINIVLDQL